MYNWFKDYFKELSTIGSSYYVQNTLIFLDGHL